MRVQLTDILAILSLALHTVSSVDLTVLEGSPVTLNTTRHEDRATVTDMKWKFNQTETIVSYSQKYRDATVYDLYKGRVEFNELDFSLTLKNVQSSDSGLYTADIDFTNKETETIARHELSVLEPVTVPTLTVVSNWSNSDSCGVSLKCTGGSVSVFTSSNTTFQSQEGDKRSLSVSFNYNNISCNHSNLVSWRKNTIELKPLCPLYKGDLVPPAGMSPCLLKILLLSVALIAMVTAVITVHVREKQKKSE